MMEDKPDNRIFNSWRDWPGLPEGWQPADPPGTVGKWPIRNSRLLAAMRRLLPGRWYKVYHHGKDGSDLHYCQHASGKIARVKIK